ncbi:unnamed protein product [Musa acuminata subsp. burmannicoides]
MLTVIAPAPLDYRLSYTAQPHHPGLTQPLSLLHHSIVAPTSLAAIALDPTLLPHLLHLLTRHPVILAMADNDLIIVKEACCLFAPLQQLPLPLLLQHSSSSTPRSTRSPSSPSTPPPTPPLLLLCFSKSIVKDSWWHVLVENM